MAIDDDAADALAIPDFWRPSPFWVAGDESKKNGGAAFFSLDLKGKDGNGMRSCFQDTHTTQN